MSDTEPQTLTDDFHQEQHTMHQKIDAWHEWWSELSEIGQPRFGEMHDRLRLIQDHLKAHFQHEEQSGFFQQVIGIQPDVEPQVTQLLSQHQKFIDKLNRLCDKLGPEDAKFESWTDAKQTFEEFLEELNAHETEEHSLFKIWSNSNST